MMEQLACPGTVVTCARAGAEYQLNLIWPLIFGSFLAFTLQEGTARLTIVSGKSLGQCLQWRYRHGRKLWNVSIICWVVAISVWIGNTFYECNNWAGGMSAIYSIPGAENTVELRVPCCLVYGAVVLVLLFLDKTDILGVGLGFVMVGMVILFLTAVIEMGVDGERFALGLLPISMPTGSANIVLSLIGTTSLGFNIFFGGAMARGKTISNAQRGIAFSTLMAFLVSVLIMLVGDGTYIGVDGKFTIASLAVTIEKLTGEAGIYAFAFGFIAAALSSMLAVPLGASLTAETVFTIESFDEHAVSTSYTTKSYSKEEDPEIKFSQQNGSNVEIEEKGALLGRPFPKKYYNGMFIAMVLISVVVISANAPTVQVILVAQVFNGCLLPFFSILLLICINDQELMKASPQKGWANFFLTAMVWVTVFLTSNTIIQNCFGWVVSKNYASNTDFDTVKLIVSAIISIIIMLLLLLCTDLGKNILLSFKRRRKNSVQSVLGDQNEP